MVIIEVLGTPAPKGSGRAMLIGGKARHVPSGSSANQRALRAWDKALAVALEGLGERWTAFPAEVPLRAEIVFRMKRPDKPLCRYAPATKPDADKLARATLDSLTGVVFYDDSRIVELVVRKVFAAPGNEGARITVEEWRSRDAG